MASVVRQRLWLVITLAPPSIPPASQGGGQMVPASQGLLPPPFHGGGPGRGPPASPPSIPPPLRRGEKLLPPPFHGGGPGWGPPPPYTGPAAQASWARRRVTGGEQVKGDYLQWSPNFSPSPDLRALGILVFALSYTFSNNTYQQPEEKSRQSPAQGNTNGASHNHWESE
jgi:hypothetical protein